MVASLDFCEYWLPFWIFANKYLPQVGFFTQKAADFPAFSIHFPQPVREVSSLGVSFTVGENRSVGQFTSAAKGKGDRCCWLRFGVSIETTGLTRTTTRACGAPFDEEGRSARAERTP